MEDQRLMMLNAFYHPETAWHTVKANLLRNKIVDRKAHLKNAKRIDAWVYYVGRSETKVVAIHLRELKTRSGILKNRRWNAMCQVWASQQDVEVQVMDQVFQRTLAFPVCCTAVELLWAASARSYVAATCRARKFYSHSLESRLRNINYECYFWPTYFGAESICILKNVFSFFRATSLSGLTRSSWWSGLNWNLKSPSL